MVKLNSVVLPNRRTIKIRPTAILRCAMAESIAARVSDDVSTQIETLGTTLRGVET
jgi:hypothetical protein